jgi:hydroxymethylglutaryl-CoA lyase
MSSRANRTGRSARDTIVIQEVGPRDGFQTEPAWVTTESKVSLIDACSRAGFSRIEVSSFVSHAAVPMLRDAADVFAGIQKKPGVTYVALVPNLEGARRAIAADANELNMVVSSSEAHNFTNVRMTCDDSLRAFSQIAELSFDSGVTLNGTIATAFGCPFEGKQSVENVMDIVSRFLRLGVQGITLADTTGMANPRQVTELVRLTLSQISPDALTLHFHNTRGMGSANVLAAYQAGARRFDASFGGLGSCPFAPGATGNICTEDLVHMCHEMGLATGIDLEAATDIARRLPAIVGHDVPGQVIKAGRSYDLHPISESLRNKFG